MALTRDHRYHYPPSSDDLLTSHRAFRYTCPPPPVAEDAKSFAYSTLLRKTQNLRFPCTKTQRKRRENHWNLRPIQNSLPTHA